MSLITQKDINNKTLIEDACKDEEAIFMAVSALQRQSEDKYMRQAYHRRQDEIYFYNMNVQKLEQAERRAEQSDRRAEQSDRRAEQAEAEIEVLRKKLAALEKK